MTMWLLNSKLVHCGYENDFGPVNEILVLIAYAQKPYLNAHDE